MTMLTESPLEVVVAIHGMTPEHDKFDAREQYRQFFGALVDFEPEIERRVPKDRRVCVQWGHPIEGSVATDADELLTAAEERIAALVDTQHTRNHPLPGDVVLHGIKAALGINPAMRLLRQDIVVRGLGDVIYYISGDGERQVRRKVYDQVLSCISPLLEAGHHVRMHIFGHSLGCTIVHDFLFGLFSKNHKPDYRLQAEDDASRRRFEIAHDAAGEKRLTVGGVAMAASQLPITLLRSPELVKALAAGHLLEPSRLGVGGKGLQWIFLYDRGDPLGFPCRRLYLNTQEIADIEVDAGIFPKTAHGGYWTCPAVQEATARLFAEQMRP
jgi:hypothetical protein